MDEMMPVWMLLTNKLNQELAGDDLEVEDIRIYDFSPDVYFELAEWITSRGLDSDSYKAALRRIATLHFQGYSPFLSKI